jgi:hypothetical protein
MLRIMRDEKVDIEIRFQAAKAAAPYFHHKLTAVDCLPSSAQPKRVTEDDDHELPDFSALMKEGSN